MVGSLPVATTAVSLAKVAVKITEEIYFRNGIVYSCTL
jgi:hypothetical protein